MKAVLRLLLVATILQLVFSAVFRSLMTKRDNLQAKLLREKRLHEFRVANRVFLAKFAKGGVQRAAVAKTPFYDYGNMEYNLQVGVGSPPQLFEVIPDMGTGQAWIVDSSCDPNNSYYDCPIFCRESPVMCTQLCEDFCCPSNITTPAPSAARRLFDHGDPCANKRQFDQTASATYEATGAPFNGSNALDDVSGVLGRDSFAFGDLTIPGVTFGQADRLSVAFTNAPWAGVVGLGFGRSGFNGQPSVIQQAIDAGLLDSPLFTIWLESKSGLPLDQPAGALTLGAIDVDHCSAEVNNVPLTSNSIYLINVDAFGTNGAKISGTYKTLVTIGAAQNIVPLAAMRDVTTATNAEYDWDYGFYEVDCSIQFTWSVWVNDDDELKVDQSTLLVNTPDGRCFLNFVYFEGGLGEVDLVLGTPFLRQYCSVYDPTNKAVGFAKTL
ncbi:putative aspartyle protease [Aphelenchoides fujianensis]|nr:putative aspartyle protease [Aphelenchoides fujianensis]